MDPFDKEEYVFYKSGGEAVKVYKNKIIYKTYYTSTFVELKKGDILSIRLELFSAQGGYHKRIAIKVKNHFLRQRIILNGLENIGQLFDVLNLWYQNEIDKDLSLDYSRYLSFEKNEKQMYSFIVYSWIFLIGFIILLILYAIATSILRSQSNEHQYTSYDKNKTINYLENNTFLCPKHFEFLNSTEYEHIYTYRNECVIGEKMVVLYEKNISKEEAVNFEFDKNKVSIADMFFYLTK